MWLWTVQEEQAYSIGKQNHQWKACDQQFVLPAEKRVMAEEQRILDVAMTSNVKSGEQTFFRSS